MPDAQYSDEALGRIVAAAVKEIGQKHDPASTASTWVGSHGPGGLLSQPGARPAMLSTVPDMLGLEDIIPLRSSVMVNEVYEMLTGMTAGEGTRAADICSEGPNAGKLKVCRQVYPYATMKIDTQTERLNNLGRRNDYADMDRNVLNLQNISHPLMPGMLQRAGNLNNDFAKMIYEAGYAVKRSYGVMDIQGVAGNVSNASDFNLWISQYDGLDQQIKTGYTDSITGAVCPAADSIIITHNAPIGSNGTNGLSFISNLENAWRSSKRRGNDVGMSDVSRVIVMHPNAFFAVVDEWACAYHTNFCAGGTNTPNNTDAITLNTLRDTLLQGQYLMIGGERVPVVFSHGMQWHGIGDNTFITDFYILPLSWRGFPLIKRQFFPLNNASASSWMDATPGAGLRIENDGLYAIGARSTNGFCTRLEIISQTRLILDAPFLAARVNDVQVAYNVSGFDPLVGMSDYRDGGQSNRAF